MDKIWYRNLSKSEVIGHCGRDEKPEMTTQNRQKLNDKKKGKKEPNKVYICNSHSLQLFVEVTPNI